MIVIEVRETQELGLTVYQVLVNGTQLNQYLSRELAEYKKSCYLKAWNIEKVYKKAG